MPAERSRGSADAAAELDFERVLSRVLLSRALWQLTADFWQSMADLVQSVTDFLQYAAAISSGIESRGGLR